MKAKDILFFTAAGIGAASAFGASFLGAFIIAVAAAAAMILTGVVYASFSGMPRWSAIAVSAVFGIGCAEIALLVANANYVSSTAQMLWMIAPVLASLSLAFGNGKLPSSALSGVKFALLLAASGLARELLGTASFFGVRIAFKPLSLFATPFGGLISVALLAALLNVFGSHDKEVG